MSTFIPARRVLGSATGEFGIANVLELGRVTLGRATGHCDWHVHDARRMEIVFFAKGRMRYLVANKPLDVSGGELYVVFPGESHAATEATHEPSTAYFLILSLADTDDHFLDLPTRQADALRDALFHLPHGPFAGSPVMIRLLEEAIAVLVRHDCEPLAMAKIRNRIEAFLLEVVHCAAHHARHGLPPRWHDLLRDIDDHLAHPPTIAEMSRRMAMSESRFKIVFKRRTGDPPGDYIRRRRIDLAKRLLLEDKDKPIACLSRELSFSTPQYFTAVFNRYTGVTPTAFRKRKR